MRPAIAGPVFELKNEPQSHRGHGVNLLDRILGALCDSVVNQATGRLTQASLPQIADATSVAAP
jgi:hypothetical protein